MKNDAVKFVNERIEDKLLNLHTAYIAKVVLVKDGRAKIQPLHKTKEKGSIATTYPVIEDVLIASYPTGSSSGKLSIKKGDIVLVLVCERSIEGGLGGKSYTPMTGKRHSMNDSVIIAKVGG